MTLILPTLFRNLYPFSKFIKIPLVVSFFSLSFGLFIGESQAQITITYESSGSHTFNAPCGLSSAKVETWGAGGRGGRRTSSGFAALGGGGGGAYTADNAFNLSSGSSFAVVVGAGGTVSNNAAGGTSSFGGAVHAYGGSSGVDRAGVDAGNGGVSAGGAGGVRNTNYAISEAGEDGQDGYYTQIIFISRYGGRGGAGANGGVGGEGADPGGNNDGSNGGFPGGGGGGAIRGGTPGSGGNGKVVVTLNFPTPAITGTNSYCTGETLVLSTAPANCGSATYQWLRNGTPIGGATTHTLTIPNLTTAHAGSYTVKVTIGTYIYTGATSVVGSSNGISTNNTNKSISGTLTSAAYSVAVNEPVINTQNHNIFPGYNVNFASTSQIGYSTIANCTDCNVQYFSDANCTNEITNTVVRGLNTNTQFWIQATDRNGCQSQAPFWVIVNNWGFSLTNTPVPTVVCLGDEVTYTFVLSNTQTVAANFIVASINTPSGLTYKSHSTVGASTNYYPSNGSWIIASLSPSAGVTLHITFTATAAGTPSVSASVLSVNETLLTENISAANSITVNDKPLCSISGNTGTVCSNESRIFSAPDAPLGDVYTYFWSISGEGTIVDNPNSQSVTVQANNVCSDSYVLTLKTTNSNNCESSCLATILIRDIVAPTITLPSEDLTMECFDVEEVATWIATASATDACRADETTLSSDYTQPADPFCEGPVVVTFTANDGCGNRATATKSFTVERTTPPAEAEGPVSNSSTVNCLSDATVPTTLPIVKDVCGNTLSTPQPVREETDTECEGSVTYTYNYQDCAGLTYDWIYTYTIDLPEFTMQSDGLSTVACPHDATEPTPPAVTDLCGRSITTTLLSVTDSPDPILYSGTRTYNYRFTDCTGYSDDWSYIYTITPNDFDMPDNESSTVSCLSQAAALSVTLPTVTDNCGSTLTPAGPLFDNSNFNGCEGYVTYTWNYTDAAGFSHDWTYTYNIDDQTAPVITVPSSDLTLKCYNVTAINAWANDATATDNCGETISVTATFDEPEDNCNQTVEVLFSATDPCGNTATATKNITINNDIKPIITLYTDSVHLGCNPESVSTELVREQIASVKDTCYSAASADDVEITAINEITIDHITIRKWELIYEKGCLVARDTFTHSWSDNKETPTIAQDANREICEGTVINFDLLENLLTYDRNNYKILFYTNSECTTPFAEFTADYSIQSNHTFYAVTQSKLTDCEAGNEDALTLEITILERPDTLTALSPQIFCTGKMISDIVYAGEETGNTITWYNSSSEPISESTLLTNGSTYEVTQTDNHGCVSVKKEITTTVNPYATQATINADNVIVCTGSNVTLTATADAVFSPVYYWYDNDGTLLETTTTGSYLLPSVFETTVTETFTYYVAVEGDNYCINSETNRKLISVVVRQLPTLKMIDPDNIYGSCLPAVFTLESNAVGFPNDATQVYDCNIKTENGTFIATNPTHGSFSPSVRGSGTPPPQITFSPQISSAIDNYITLEFWVNSGACGIIRDTVKLAIWNKEVTTDFSFINQPNTLPDLCEDFQYELKVKAFGEGALDNIKIALDDYKSTGILIREAHYWYEDQDASHSEWRSLSVDDSEYEYFILTIPNTNDDILKGGDSLIIKVITYADCGFFSGSDIKFTLEGSDACGLPIDYAKKEIISDVINIDLGNNSDKYSLSSEIVALDKAGVPIDIEQQGSTGDVNYLLDNQLNKDKIVTWKASIQFPNGGLPDFQKDSIYFLIPTGMVLDTFKCTSNPAFYTNNTIKPTVNESVSDINGLEYCIAFPPEYTTSDGDIDFEMDIIIKDAKCGNYDVYMEIISTIDNVLCTSSNEYCTVYKTESGSYFTMDIQWYEMNFVVNDTTSYGVMFDSSWRGRYEVRNVSAFYSGDDLFIDFYVDKNGNGQLDTEDVKVADKQFTTVANQAGKNFILDPNINVPAEIECQLLAVHYGTSCHDMVVPLPTLFGPDEVCVGDIEIFTAPKEMNRYTFNTILDLGATAMRLPLDESTPIGVNDHQARFEFTHSGKATLEVCYDIPDGTPTGTHVMITKREITIHDRPADPKLAENADTTVCDGNRIDVELLLSLMDYNSTTDTLIFYTDDSFDNEFTNPVTSAYGTVYDFYVLSFGKISNCQSVNHFKLTITVDSLPKMPALVDQANTLFCAGTTIDEALLTSLIEPVDGVSLAFYNDITLSEDFTTIMADYDDVSYTIYLLPTIDATDCRASSANVFTLTLTVKDEPAISDINAPAMLCSGNPLFLSTPSIDENGGIITNSGWLLNDLLYTNENVMYTQNGASLKYFAVNECDSVLSNSVTITVIDIPTIADIVAPPIVCAGNPLSLTDPELTDNGGAITNYGWLLNDVPYTDAPVRYSQHGQVLRFFAVNECDSLLSNWVTISVKDKPSIADIEAPAAVCAGNPLSLTAPSVEPNRGTITNFGWLLNDEVYTHTNVTYVQNGVTLKYFAVNECDSVFSNEVTITVRDSATITITTPDAICAGSLLSLNEPVINLKGGIITNQNWQLENSVGENDFATFEPATPLTYSDNGKKLRYTVSTECGTVFSNKVIITVKDKATVDIVTPAAICAGNSLSLDEPEINLKGGETENEEWQIEGAVGSAIFTTFDPSTTLTYDDNRKRLYYTITTECGTVNSDSVTITVKDEPTIDNIIAPDALCAGNPLSLTAPTVTDNGSLVTKEGWLLDDMIYAGEDVIYAQNEATLKYYAVNGCDSVVSNSVMITVKDKASIGTVTAPAPVCSGNPLDLTNTPLVSENGGTISKTGWLLNDLIYTDANVTYDQNGAILKYYVISECDSVVSSGVAITVYPLPDAPFASSPQTFCPEEQVSDIDYSISQQDQDAGNSTTWYDVSGEIPTTTGLVNGSYWVTQTDANSCESQKTEVIAIVNPRATIATIGTKDEIICTGSQATIEVTAADVIVPHYYWYDENGVILEGSDNTNRFTTPTITVNTTDTFYYYVAVEGDNYCENLPENRDKIAVVVLQKPEVEMITDPLNGICYPGTFRIDPIVTGLYGDKIQSFQFYIMKPDSTYDIPFGVNGIFTPPSGGETDITDWHVNYSPEPVDAIENIINLALEINTGVCSIIRDTIQLWLWPLPVDNEFVLISEPDMPASTCEEVNYEFKIYANGKGGMKKIILELDDYVGTGITGLRAQYQHIATSEEWIDMEMDDRELEHFYFTIPDEDFQLAGPTGDSITVRVTVYPGCDFFAGGDFRFNLDASGVCGIYTIDQKSIYTEPFEIDFGDDPELLPTYSFISYLEVTKGDNLEPDNNEDRTYLVDNSLPSKTIRWHSEYSISDNLPDFTKDSIYFLIPEGLELVLGSFSSSHSGYEGILPVVTYDDDKGIEYSLPIPENIQLGEQVYFSLSFSVEGTPCDYYDFYMEIIHQADLACDDSFCTFYRTEAESYFGVDVQWLEYEMLPTAGVGNMNGDNWSGRYDLRAITQSFGGSDTATIQVYIDNNNDGVVDDGDQELASYKRQIPPVSAGSQYTVTVDPSDPIVAEPGKQLLLLHTSDIFCEETTVMAATLFGPDELCKGETGLFTAPSGMNQYSFTVSSVSDVIPTRISLDGQTPVNPANDAQARYRFDVAGVYTVTLYYTLDYKRAVSIRRTITVHELPAVPTLLDNVDASVCDGEEIDVELLLSLLHNDPTVDTLLFYSDQTLITPFSGSITTDYNSATEHLFYVVTKNKTTDCLSDGAFPLTILVDKRPDAPTVTADAHTAICEEQTITEALLLSLIEYDDTKVEIEIYANAACTEQFEEIVTDYSQNNQHKIYLIAKDIVDATRCKTLPSSALELTMEVLQLPASLTAISPQTFCPEDTIGSIVYSDAVGGNAITWYNSSNEIIPVTTGLVNGSTYSVTQTDGNNCESHKTEIKTNVKYRAVATDISINNETICTASSATFTAEVDAMPQIQLPLYYWYDENGDLLADSDNGNTYTTHEFNVTEKEIHTYYVGVEGDNYCVNHRENRKEVTVTILPKPEVEIMAMNGTGICFPGSFRLLPIVSHLEGRTVNSFQWKIKNANGDFVNPNGSGTFSPPNGQNTDTADLETIYVPILADAINNIITLVLEIETGTCGMISDTIELTLLPLPVEGIISIISQPEGLIDICEEFTYELEIEAVGNGGLTNISITLDDYKSTGIEGVSGVYEYFNQMGESCWRDMEVTQGFESYLFSIPAEDFADTGDSILMGGEKFSAKITVIAGCEFYSGSDILFILNASDACGTFSIKPEEVATDEININFGIENDAEYSLISEISAKDKNGDDVDFGYGNYYGEDREYLIDNNFNKSITWTTTFTVKDAAPDLETDSLYFLIPMGMKFVDTLGSISSTTHPDFYRDITPEIEFSDENGLEYVIPMPDDFTVGDTVTFSFEFDVCNAECGDHYFYIEIISTRELYCVTEEEECEVYETRAGSYFDLKIQWYEMVFDNASPISGGTMTGDNWRGQYRVHNISAFYDNDDLNIDFYIDRNANGIADPEEKEDTVAHQHFYTVAGEADAYFTLDPAIDVPAEIGYQLLAVHHGASCYDMEVPISTIFGPEELCKGDTAIWVAPKGMELYSFGTTVTSGSAPIRLPLPGQSSHQRTDDSARYCFPAAGEYAVTLSYNMKLNPQNPSADTRIMSVKRNVIVHELPTTPSLLPGVDASVCDGETIDIELLSALIDFPSETDTLLFYTDDDLTTEFTGSIITDYNTISSHVFYAIAVNKRSGCKSADYYKLTVDVDERPSAPTLNTTADASLCDGETITENFLLSLIEYDDSEVAIEFYSDELCEDEFSEIEADRSEAQIHTFWAIARSITDITGCATEIGDAQPINIAVDERPATPELNENANMAVCDGETITIQFLASLIDYNAAEVEIKFYQDAACAVAFQDTITDISNAAEHKFYALSKSVTDPTGCATFTTSPLEMTITVNPRPAAPTILDGAYTSVCDGDVITVASVSDLLNYNPEQVDVAMYITASCTWELNEITTNYSMNTEHTIYVRSIDKITGCGTRISDARPVMITVNSIPPQPMLVSNADLGICQGESKDLLPLFVNTLNRVFDIYEVDDDGELSDFVGNNSDNPYIIIHPVITTNYRAFVSTSGCRNTTNPLDFTITVEEPIHITSSYVVAQPSCGFPTGSIFISARGGSGNYLVSWDNGLFYEDMPEDGKINGLSAGIYSIYVINADNTSCSPAISAPIPLISHNSDLTLQVETSNSSACGTEDGSIILLTGGGSMPYTYRISGLNEDFISMPDNNTVSNLPSGIYEILLRDAIGCITGAVTTVDADAGMTAEIIEQVNATCAVDGYLEIKVMNGTPPYRHQLNSDSYVNMIDDTARIVIGAGNHTLRILDHNDCFVDVNVDIDFEDDCYAEIIDIREALCDGATGGGFTIALDPTKRPVTYSIGGRDPQSVPTTGNVVVDNLAAGSYSVELDFGNDCLFYLNNIEIGRDPSCIIEIRSIYIDAYPTCILNNGKVVVEVVGGSGNYLYNTNNGSVRYQLNPEGVIEGLAAGTHTFYIWDAELSNCSPAISQPITLNASTSDLSVIATSTPATDCSSPDGTISIQIFGGFGTSQYSISGSDFEDVPAYPGTIGTNFVSDNYRIVVRDAAGCATSSLINVQLEDVNVDLEVDIIEKATCSSDAKVGISIVAPASTGTWRYRIAGGQWNPFVDNKDTLYLTAGNHVIYLENQYGCNFTDTIAVDLEGTDLVATAIGMQSDCRDNAAISLTISGGEPDYSVRVAGDDFYTYLFSEAGTKELTNIPLGQYFISVTDDDGCTYTISDVEVREELNYIIAVNDYNLTFVNQSVSGDVLDNDMDFLMNRDLLSVYGFSEALHGNIDISENGFYTYTPNSDFVGGDTISYIIKHECGYLHNAFLFITIKDIDIAPNAPIAISDIYQTDMNVRIDEMDILLNDIAHGGELTVSGIIIPPVHGTLIDNGDDTYSYEPDINYVGDDYFCYRVCNEEGLCDSTWVTIIVIPDGTGTTDHIFAFSDYFSTDQDTELSVLLENNILRNDLYPESEISVSVVTAPNHGTVLDVEDDGTFTYIPDAGFSGNDLFQYELCVADGSVACDSAWVNIIVFATECQVIMPPVVSSPQIFCYPAYVSDLLASGINVKWYESDTSSTSLDPTKLLVDEKVYYASQTDEFGCESQQRSPLKVFLKESILLDAPQINSPQELCPQATIANIITNDPNITWYDAETDGNVLELTTQLQDEASYWASLSAGDCESESRTEVIIYIVDDVNIVPAIDNQSFCQGAILSDIVVGNQSDILWYLTETGGEALSSSTRLTSRNYWGEYQVGNCISSHRFQVAVTIDKFEAPVAASEQFYCCYQTLADLVITGVGITWYDESENGAVLPNTTTLEDGKTYYAVQSNGTCVGEALAITAMADTTRPSFTVPRDTTLYKNAACYADTSIASTGTIVDAADNCTIPPIITHSDEITPTCSSGYIIARTWTVADSCGNTVNKIQTITVRDTITPTFTAPADIDVYVDLSRQFDTTTSHTGTVTINSENCTPYDKMVVSYSDEVVSTGCGYNMSITRTWRVSDSCNNEAPAQTQTITVLDTLMPGLTLLTDTIRAGINTVRTISLHDIKAGADIWIHYTLNRKNSMTTESDSIRIEKDEFPTYDWAYQVPADSGTFYLVLRRIADINGCQTLLNDTVVIIATSCLDLSFEIDCPEDTVATLAYGFCEYSFTTIGKPKITILGADQSLDTTITITHDAPEDLTFERGVYRIKWIAENECGDKDSCYQWVIVNYPPCNPVDTLWYVAPSGQLAYRLDSLYAVDYEGKRYKTTRINCDCWMAENLQSTIDRDGYLILSTIYNAYGYSDTAANLAKYGRLYSGNSASNDGVMDANGNVPGICPDGWVLPTVAKYEGLIGFGSEALREVNEWLYDDYATNSTQFAAMPAGYWHGVTNSHLSISGDAYFWTADCYQPIGKIAHIRYSCPVLQIENFNTIHGASVRCVKVN